MKKSTSNFISLSLMFIGIFFWIMFYNQLVIVTIPLLVLLIQGFWAVYVVLIDEIDGTD